MIKKVISVDKDASIIDACDVYKNNKVGCLLVEHNNECLGIVTERDIIERTICEKKDPEKSKISEIMSSNLKIIYALDTIEKAIHLMKKYKVKRLPVVTNNEIVGIISVTDISKARPEFSKRFMDSWVRPVWKD